MSKGELPERAGGPLTTEQHALARESERRNPFTAEIAGEKPPYSPEVFDKVHLKLVDMVDDYPWQDWYGSRLGREDKDDVVMVAEGFRTVAYDHLSGYKQAALQDQFYEDVAGGGYLGYPVEERFSAHQRRYRDRFELTYPQALAVQKVMRYVGEDYDPGGEQSTPENLAKRTFYYDDYLGRPIRKDYPDQDDALMAKPEHEREIAEYVRAKKTQPRTPLKPL